MDERRDGGIARWKWKGLDILKQCTNGRKDIHTMHVYVQSCTLYMYVYTSCIIMYT